MSHSTPGQLAAKLMSVCDGYGRGARVRVVDRAELAAVVLDRRSERDAAPGRRPRSAAGWRAMFSRRMHARRAAPSRSRDEAAALVRGLARARGRRPARAGRGRSALRPRASCAARRARARLVGRLVLVVGVGASPASESLNSRMPLPTERPASGSFFGPRTSRAITRTTTSSMGPMLGMTRVTLLAGGRDVSAACAIARRYHQTVESRFSISSTGSV